MTNHSDNLDKLTRDLTRDEADLSLDDIRTGIQVPTGVCIFAGLWLVASSTFLPASLRGSANNLVFGIITALLTVVRYFWAPRVQLFSWIVCACGLWVAVSPFVMGFAGNYGLTVNDVIAGLLIAVFGCYAGIGARRNWAGTPTAER